MAGGHRRRLPGGAGPSYRAVRAVHQDRGRGDPGRAAADDARRGARCARRRVADGGRGVGAALGGRGRPRRRRVPRAPDDAGAVRLRRPELRGVAAARHPSRAGAGSGTAGGRGRQAPAGRRALQRVRVQDPGGHGLRPPRPAGVRPGLLGRLRARSRRDPCGVQEAVRDQVRAAGLRAEPGDRRPRLPRRRRRPGQRLDAAGGRLAVRRRARGLPADPVVRPRALRRRALHRLRPVQAVPARHRAARTGGGRAGAPLRPAR